MGELMLVCTGTKDMLCGERSMEMGTNGGRTDDFEAHRVPPSLLPADGHLTTDLHQPRASLLMAVISPISSTSSTSAVSAVEKAEQAKQKVRHPSAPIRVELTPDPPSLFS